MIAATFHGFGSLIDAHGDVTLGLVKDDLARDFEGVRCGLAVEVSAGGEGVSDYGGVSSEADGIGTDDDGVVVRVIETSRVLTYVD